MGDQMKIIKVTDHSIALTWNKDPFNKQKQLWALQINGGKVWENAYRGYGNNATVDDLKPKTEYLLRLKGDDQNQKTIFFGPIKVTTEECPSTMEELFKAIQDRNAKAVKQILEKGSLPLNSTNSYKKTPLMVAAQSGFTDGIELLLDHGADIAVEGFNGRNCFMEACREGHSDIVSILLSRGSSWNDTDSNGNTPLHIAIDGNQYHVVEMALKAGASTTSRDRIRGWTPLMKCAVLGKDIRIAKLLMDTNPNFDDIDYQGMTPLMLAVLASSFPIIKVLIEVGADINKASKYGETALELSKSKKQKEIINYLNNELNKYNKEMKELHKISAQEIVS